MVLTARQGGEWGYKDLCEAMGPHEAAAPLKFLALLSPLDPETDRHAQAWRDNVRATHEAKRKQLRARPGDIVEFPSRSSSAGA